MIQAMERYPSHVDVQEFSCRLLNNLCVRHDMNKVALVRQGGIESVLCSMRNHAGVAGINMHGARLLYNLSVNPDLRKILVKRSVREACLDAAKLFSESSPAGREISQVCDRLAVV